MVYGWTALMHIFMYLLCIYMSYWALQSLNLEKCFKFGNDNQIKIFYLLLAIVIGFITASFFLEVIQLFKNFLYPFVG